MADEARIRYAKRPDPDEEIYAWEMAGCKAVYLGGSVYVITDGAKSIKENLKQSAIESLRADGNEVTISWRDNFDPGSISKR